MTKTLLSLGHGFSARALAPLLIKRGWRVIGTTRNPAKLGQFEREGVEPLIWPGDELPFDQATHLLTSVAPKDEGDPVLNAHSRDLKAAKHLEWVGYLSTTGVYGDHQGGWVDESAAMAPSTKRGQARVQAETEWGQLGLPLHIFRLAGIYGPGRGPFAKVRKGTARRIIKKNQVFSRIHVEDIASTVLASIDKPNPGAAYNVCDNDPAPPQDVIAYAAQLLDMPLPPAVNFEEAQMTPMARSFYAESKRVKNDRIKNELGVTLKYPDYKTALQAMLKAEET